MAAAQPTLPEARADPSQIVAEASLRLLAFPLPEPSRPDAPELRPQALGRCWGA
jgi:hypothetical protein